MPFEKGHKGGNGGRQKGGTNKQHLIRYQKKTWTKITNHNIYNQEEIEHRLNNNLPIDDLIDTMNEKFDSKKRKKHKKWSKK